MSTRRSILLLGPGKSGTTALFYSVIEGSRAVGEPYEGGFEPRDEKQLMQERRPGVVVKMLHERLGAEHLHLTEQFDRFVYIWRDPRDNILSRILYQFGTSIPEEKKSERSAVIKLLKQKEEDPSSISLKRLVDKFTEIRGGDTVRTYLNSSLLPVNVLTGRLKVFLMRYEDFVDGRTNGLSNYLNFRVEPESKEDRGHAHVRRTALYGDWKNWFLDEDVDTFVKPYRREYIIMGYNPDAEPFSSPAIAAETASMFVQRNYDRLDAKKLAGAPPSAEAARGTE